jgi:hypothetical protein
MLYQSRPKVEILRKVEFLPVSADTFVQIAPKKGAAVVCRSAQSPQF